MNIVTEQATVGKREPQRLIDGQACPEAALEYVARGWSALAICPPDHFGVGEKHSKDCQSPGKAPWGPWKEFQDRRATVDEIRRKWRDNPTLNVGIALGPVSGLVRVDVDGPGGELRLAELSKGDLPPTLEFKSGRENNGRGLLFKIPGGVELRTTVQQRGKKEELRFQAKGAQTVLPPSRHPTGSLYTWTNLTEPAMMPGWLIDALKPAPVKRHETNGHLSSLGTADDENVAEALKHVPGADDYDSWFKIGMALHSLNNSAGLDLWCDWSSTSNKYTRGACEAKWQSFKPDGGITVATVFGLARKAGWRPASPKVKIGTPKASTEAEPQNVVQIILADLIERYQGSYKCGTAIVCADGSELTMGQVCQLQPTALLKRTENGTDAPRLPGVNGVVGAVKVAAMPAVHRNWIKAAYSDFLAGLQEEDTAPDAEVPMEKFRDLIRQALVQPVKLGTLRESNGAEDTQVRSLVD